MARTELIDGEVVIKKVGDLVDGDKIYIDDGLPVTVKAIISGFSRTCVIIQYDSGWASALRQSWVRIYKEAESN